MGDLNGDGRADVVVAIFNSFSPRVSVLLGNADGTLQAPVNAAVFAQFSGTCSVAIGRMNADAVPDLVVCNLNGNSVAVLLGNGDGTFQAPIFTTVSSVPISVAVGDLNADGFNDVVTANKGSNNAGVLLGNGNGTLQAPVYYAVGELPEDIAIGRWDADAIPDLVVTDQGASPPGTTVSVLRGNGNGTFQARVPVQVGSVAGPWGVAPMQLEVNGTPVPGFIVSLRDANRLFQVTGSSGSAFTGPLDPRGVAAADLNGDGRDDAVVAHTNPAGISVYVGTGNVLNPFFTTFPTGQNLTQTVAAGDINADGRIDVATGDGNTGTVTVFLNTTSGGITQQPQAAAVPEGQSVTFSVVASGAVSYRWRRDCVELSDGGAYSGTGTSTLTVSGVSAKELGDYDVLVTPSCDGPPVVSRYAALLLTPAPACPADFNNDGVVNSTDVSDFINTWFTFEPTGCP